MLILKVTFVSPPQGRRKHSNLGARHIEGIFFVKKRGHFLKIKRPLLCSLQNLGARPPVPRFLRLCTLCSLSARNWPIYSEANCEATSYFLPLTLTQPINETTLEAALFWLCNWSRITLAWKEYLSIEIKDEE